MLNDQSEGTTTAKKKKGHKIRCYMLSDGSPIPNCDCKTRTTYTPFSQILGMPEQSNATVGAKAR